MQGQFGEGSAYWLYGVKMLLVSPLLAFVWPHVKELRWRFSPEAVIAGILVFALWVGLDPHYPKWSDAPESPWNPFTYFESSTGIAWIIVVLRILGTTLLVPPVEEAFYRSFLYRYLTKSDFLSMPLGKFDLRSFIIVSAVFGIAHFEWLPGILCGLTYQWLVIRKQRLGDAMTAHAITNLLLGLWVVWKGQWQFW